MASRSLRIRESLRIARPLDVVRRHFGDVRHHAARRVHAGVTFTPLAESAHECRYLHAVRILGIPQRGEVILTDAPDGSQLNRFVTGPNTGMTIGHAFEPAGAGATMVAVTIEMPLPGLRRLFAPVVGWIVRRQLVHGLEEDRHDLEVRGYPVPA